jgi:6-phosphofructokinase 1
MSRPPTVAAPIVRTRTLEQLDLGIQFDEINEQSQADLPKVVPADTGAGGAGSDPRHLLSNPTLAKFSKVLLSQNSKVLRPPHLSEWTKVGSFPSPLSHEGSRFNRGLSFVPNTETILVDVISDASQTTISREFLRAGPRETLAFHPSSQVKACILSCGGLCPGLNSVIRELVTTLVNVYKVNEPISGIPFGLRGFYDTNLQIIPLTIASVASIHHQGGSILGSSRGGFDCQRICDAIESYGFNHVYLIGGDGSHRAAMRISDELRVRKAKVAIVGLAKTIDNDLALIDRSFGFDTAVEEAQRAIQCAKVEARSAINGIGLVKLMGRHSGQIAMFSCLASREVDCCLIPEIDFVLEGPCGLFENIRDVLRVQKHMVIVVAEGAATNLLAEEAKQLGSDASGNAILPDVGTFLKRHINAWAADSGIEINLKLIDPTYQIRSVPPNASDQLYCSLLAQSAVHGAMAGFTGFTVGMINTHFVLIGMNEITRRGRCKVDVKSRMWNRLLTATGQPILSGVESKSSSSSNLLTASNSLNANDFASKSCDAEEADEKTRPSGRPAMTVDGLSAALDAKLGVNGEQK